MSKKEVFEGKKIILGFDETNNGFDLFHTNPYYSSSQLIVCFVMEDPKRANYGALRGESKRNCRYFKKRPIVPKSVTDEILKKGREYIGAHQDFLYTTIPKELKKERPIHMLKGDAIALLAIKAIETYNLDSRKTQIVIDQIDGPGPIPSERAGYVLDMWLEKAGLEIPISFKQHGDSKVIAIRRADIIGYYLAAIHLFGTRKKWPYVSHKVSFNQLEQIAIDFNYANDKEYSDSKDW